MGDGDGVGNLFGLKPVEVVEVAVQGRERLENEHLMDLLHWPPHRAGGKTLGPLAQQAFWNHATDFRDSDRIAVIIWRGLEKCPCLRQMIRLVAPEPRHNAW